MKGDFQKIWKGVGEVSQKGDWKQTNIEGEEVLLSVRSLSKKNKKNRLLFKMETTVLIEWRTFMRFYRCYKEMVLIYSSFLNKYNY